MALQWRQLRKLVIRGPDPVNDPVRASFHHVQPHAGYQQAYIADPRSRGGDAFALGPPSPYNNPIGNGIVYQDPMGIFGPPPARYAMGTFFFLYPTPGQAIAETVQPGGPLLDPATLAALIGQPQSGVVTTPAIGAADNAARRFNMSF